ncbi:probable E3 ubiquitin-protein ligase HERC3, partial [Anneissia japonica]|uniref:probable E3 ubiquitin-protein ligase HERC3 n=1 Tax=Anneissia japonica TaxID=1529436 RepID=UPI001425705F
MGASIKEFNPINHVAPPMPLVLTVNRHDIVASTLKQLNNKSQQDLQKPLMVKFEDESVVFNVILRKEFFLLIFREILNPEFGMFKEYGKARTIWFNPQVSFLVHSRFR